ncbi:hypothetical protein R1sor_022980 [Riccia sorocarpa]|uniref:Reverse transcriptase zinc-binding domain-containing protein n=1 Tax=Riccia sorocarpa TaxID=122646 RepID=A0ABD3GNL6_9MARC
MVTPLGSGQVPEWVRSIGCELAEGSKKFWYLGIMACAEVKEGDRREESAEVRRLEDWAKAQNVAYVDQVADRDGRLDMHRIQEGPNGLSWVTPAEREFETWLRSLKVGSNKLVKVQGWVWKLNRNWVVQSTPSEWKDRWRRLWQGSSLPKHKLEIWRMLQQGFATLDMASKWGVSDGTCQVCQREKETLIHLMWECSGVRDRALWIAGVVGGSR